MSNAALAFGGSATNSILKSGERISPKGFE